MGEHRGVREFVLVLWCCMAKRRLKWRSITVLSASMWDYICHSFGGEKHSAAQACLMHEKQTSFLEGPRERLRIEIVLWQTWMRVRVYDDLFRCSERRSICVGLADPSLLLERCVLALRCAFARWSLALHTICVIGQERICAAPYVVTVSRDYAAV